MNGADERAVHGLPRPCLSRRMATAVEGVTSDRPHRKELPPALPLTIIARGRDTQVDPAAADGFRAAPPPAAMSTP